MDNLYDFDEAALEAVRKAKPWTNDPKHFRKVIVSASATMKMLTHACSGARRLIDSRCMQPW